MVVVGLVGWLFFVFSIQGCFNVGGGFFFFFYSVQCCFNSGGDDWVSMVRLSFGSVVFQ